MCVFYHAENNSHLEQMKMREQASVNLQEEVTKDSFDFIVSDLLFLAGQTALTDFCNSDDNGERHWLEKEFYNFLFCKKKYNHVVFLDKSGKEKVRVNYNKGDPWVVFEGKLQDKSRRYYFEDSIALDEREVFISPLDLNIERGHVEKPFKPMIRFGTPIFDAEGNKDGVLIFNYLAEDLFERISGIDASSASVKMMLNSKGYWLIGPDRESEWGFMLPERKDVSFTNAYPQEWKRILKDKQGQFCTDNGLFTFTTIHPLREGYRSSTGAAGPYLPSRMMVSSAGYFWVLVSHMPEAVISRGSSQLLSGMLMLGAILFVVVAAGALAVAMALTRRRIYQERLINMAMHDSLTGLPNRKLFFDRLETMIREAERYGRAFALVYIDLNGFKKINDNLGHTAGDELLIIVSRLLEKSLRKSDTVARLGGDEFAVLLPEVGTPARLKEVCSKIYGELSVPVKLGQKSVQISLSAGAALFPLHGGDAGTLVKLADSAMYSAKKNGKDGCVMVEICEPEDQST
ncbi:sensor domain-containing diguanylate cyclase [Desulfovibrio sp. JC010]|uniref:sensor domain-containing diguanylate cyclase n=1 Tax=Desulfovibrio sp. JC010 TaxID=2593641 RepID=UPI0013D36888|nr:sensor domain-containing diguanylate cyclase [Desulfovibrio sp. JC010]